MATDYKGLISQLRRKQVLPEELPSSTVDQRAVSAVSKQNIEAARQRLAKVRKRPVQGSSEKDEPTQ